MHFGNLVLFTLCLPGAARRCLRFGAHHDAQQQTSAFTKALEVSADAREAFHPPGLQAGALNAARRRGLRSPGPRAPPRSARSGAPLACRRLSELLRNGRAGSPPSRAAPRRRFAAGPRRAAVALRAGGGFGEMRRARAWPLSLRFGGRRPVHPRLSVDVDEVFWEDGLTCVEYETADGTAQLGVYVKSSMVEPDPHIRPLCASSEDDGVSALFCDEDVPSVPLSAVRRVLDPDYVYVSMRQAGGGQGLGNPHGEHGEDCYDLRDLEISEGVVFPVREGRDWERVL